eukprot:gene5757-6950_t
MGTVRRAKVAKVGAEAELNSRTTDERVPCIGAGSSRSSSADSSMSAAIAGPRTMFKGRQGGGEAPALEPVAGEGHDPEDGEEEDDVMSLAHEFEFTPAEPGGGDYI